MTAYNNVTLSSVGNSPAIIIQKPNASAISNTSISGLGLICTLSNGASLTYTVQVSADDPTGPLGIQNWNAHDTLVNQTASANGNIAYPVTAVRLNCSVWSSGSVTLGVAQWP